MRERSYWRRSRQICREEGLSLAAAKLLPNSALSPCKSGGCAANMSVPSYWSVTHHLTGTKSRSAEGGSSLPGFGAVPRSSPLSPRGERMCQTSFDRPISCFYSSRYFLISYKGRSYANFGSSGQTIILIHKIVRPGYIFHVIKKMRLRTGG